MVRSVVGSAGVFVLGLVLLLGAPAGAVTVEESLAQQFRAEIDAERAARGRPPLPEDPAVASAASEWAAQMRSAGALRHSAHNRVEIIGVGPTTASVTRAWIASPRHRDILLDPNLAAVGVGVHCAADGQLWVVAQFRQLVVGQATPGGTPADAAVSSEAAAPSCGQPVGVAELVGRLYLTILGRPVDPSGLATYSQMAAGGAPPSVIARHLISSAEFASRHGQTPDSGFVAAAYRSVLGREPDAGGQVAFDTVLRSQGRSAVLMHLASSAEFSARVGGR